jgi:hypothetical protein
MNVWVRVPKEDRSRSAQPTLDLLNEVERTMRGERAAERLGTRTQRKSAGLRTRIRVHCSKRLAV